MPILPHLETEADNMDSRSVASHHSERSQKSCELGVEAPQMRRHVSQQSGRRTPAFQHDRNQEILPSSGGGRSSLGSHTQQTTQAAAQAQATALPGAATGGAMSVAAMEAQETLSLRPADRSKNRAAYLTSWRKVCRGIFEAVEEPDNTDTVYSLKQVVQERWNLYVSAHKDFLAHTELSDKRLKTYARHQQQYYADQEDSIRTLDAYLRREEKARERARDRAAKREQVEASLVIERARVAREIQLLETSVDKLRTQELALQRNRTTPRRKVSDFDLFEMEARRQQPREGASAPVRENMSGVRDELRQTWRRLAEDEDDNGASPETTQVKRVVEVPEDILTRLSEPRTIPEKSRPDYDENEDDEPEFQPRQRARTPPRRTRGRYESDADFVTREARKTERRRNSVTSSVSSLGYSLPGSPPGGARRKRKEVDLKPETTDSVKPIVASKPAQQSSGPPAVPVPTSAQELSVSAAPFQPSSQNQQQIQNQAVQPPVVTQVTSTWDSFGMQLKPQKAEPWARTTHPTGVPAPATMAPYGVTSIYGGPHVTSQNTFGLFSAPPPVMSTSTTCNKAVFGIQ